MQGAEAYFEERIAGEYRKAGPVHRIIPDRYIEFTPRPRLVELLMPSISFSVDPRMGGPVLTQRIRIRTGPIGARLNRREFDAVRIHMREEGENLKSILETLERGIEAGMG